MLNTMNGDRVELSSQLPSQIKGDAHLGLCTGRGGKTHSLTVGVCIFSYGEHSLSKWEGRKTRHGEYQSRSAAPGQGV